MQRYLDRLQHRGLVALRPLHSLAGGGVSGHYGLAGALAVHIHQLVQVKPRPLLHLDLPDVDVMEGVDTWKT